MIWVGSHSGGLRRFDRQTGKFLPEYFDLGHRQLPGDKAGLKTMYIAFTKIGRVHYG